MKLAALVLGSTALLVGGCVDAPPTFTPNVAAARVRLAGSLGTVTATVDPAAQSAGDVRMVVGHDAIPDLWQRGLASALGQSRLLDGSARVLDVTVTIYRMRPPRTGATIDTPARARYQLIDAKSRAVVFEAVVESNGHIAAGENFLGVVRIRDSIDRAVQGNIKQFIDRLAKTSALPLS